MPEGFAMMGGRTFFRPAGTVSFNEAVAWVSGAIAVARESGARDMLVNSTALAGGDESALICVNLRAEWRRHRNHAQHRLRARRRSRAGGR